MTDFPSMTARDVLAVTIRVLYHQESQGWWAESPDIDGWTVAGETYEEVRQLVEDGLSFALASAAEDRGEGLTSRGLWMWRLSITCRRPPEAVAMRRPRSLPAAAA